MRIFIDGMNLLRVESNEYINVIELNNNDIVWSKNEGENQFFVTKKPIELHNNDTITVNSIIFPLEIGIVTLTKEFEKKFRYDGLLGYHYKKEETTFALFSPVAKQIFVVIDDIEYPMVYQEPIWKAKISEDLEGSRYHYKIRLVDSFKSVDDPYAVATTKTGNVIIDWDKTLKINKSPIKVKRMVDTIIYEGHVRDLTINLDVEDKGLYLGMIQKSKTLKGSVIDYVKKLGMTHLQLLPVYDFHGVDDCEKETLYNWGYNPSQYFCLEGWFSKNPDDPYARINEFKQLINQAHKIKLGVNMDVVFNHVYDHKTFPYDEIVPGYFYRHDKSYQMTHSCYLDNDVETRNYMVRKLLVDNLIHWAMHYQIDGFRFDLMGLLDIETMLVIEKELKKINPHIMLYGEGWNMSNAVSLKNRSNMKNQTQFRGYSHFNDYYRNTMKGELHGDGIGFTMGSNYLAKQAMEAIIGSPHLFSTPNQSINYVECHDNSTYYDKILATKKFGLSEIKIRQDLANHLILVSQGVPFFHAGQELYRTKKGVENSYNSADEINQITWNSEQDSIKKLKKLIRIRKKYSLYRQDEYNSLVTISRENKIIVYRLENEKEILIHYIKNYCELEKVPLMKGTLIFPSQKALTEKDFIYIDQPGIYIVHIIK